MEDAMTDAQRNTHIEYLEAENAIVCKEHGIALTLSRLDEHLRSYHHERTHQQRLPTTSYFHAIAPRATDPGEVCYANILQSPPRHAYTNLKLPVPGFACGHCHYSTPNERIMKDHLFHKHDIPGHKRRSKFNPALLEYRPAHLQTFFDAIRERHWFEVRKPQPVAPVLPPGEAVLQRMLDEQWKEAEAKRARLQETSVIDPNPHQSMSHPWLEKTGWARHLAGQNLREIANATKAIGVAQERARTEEHSAMLLHVQNAVESMLEGLLRSIPQLSIISRRHLANFQGGVDGRLTTEPVSIKQRKETHERYFRHWSRFILYLLRVCLFERLQVPIRCSADQTRLLRETWEIAEGMGPTVTVEPQLVDTVRALSLSLVKQEFQGDPYKSPLVCYMAARAAKESDDAWLTISTYTSIIMGMVWDAQLLIGDECYRRYVSDSSTNLDTLVKSQSRRWLSNTISSPISVLLDQNIYASKVTRGGSGIGEIQWSQDARTLLYKDKSFTLVELSLFVGRLFEEAERILAKDLLFAPGHPEPFLLSLLSPERLAGLRDFPSNALFGYSFLDLAANELGELKDLVKTRVSINKAFEVKDGVLRSRKDHEVAYLKAVGKFMELLLAIFYFTGGMPPRMTEIQGLTWRNTENYRNIFFYEGMILYRLTYSKTQAIQGRSRPIGRFLPPRAARLLVVYLGAILPYVYYLQAADAFVKTPLLLADFHGEPWSTAKISGVFDRLSTRIIGKSLNVSGWRHMVTAIGRQYLRLGESDLVHGDEVADDAFVAQAGHSAEVERRVYGQEAILGDLLDWENLKYFLRSSLKFHNFFHVEKDLAPLDEVRVERGLAVHPIPTRDAVLAALRRLHGPRATFRSQTQKEAVLAILNGDVKELVVIMPTGAGKSSLFLLPPLVETHVLNVVIIPLRALRADIERRYEMAGISFSVFDAESSNWQPEVAVVLVSADIAPSQNFRAAISRMLMGGRLVRFFYDEAHLLITQQTFRRVLQELVELRQFDQCQHIFLTATLPPSFRRDLETSMILQAPLYLHQSTRRPNIGYNVFVGQDERSVDAHLKSLVSASTGKTVVYCRSRNEATSQAEALACNVYFSDSANGPAVLRKWLQGDIKVIVATGALGLGVDRSDVDLVVHVNLPYGLVEFAQESGRAGRAEQPATSWILSCLPWEAQRLRRKESINFGFDENQIAMHEYMITRDCRRLVLESFLDGGESLMCARDQQCDNCVRRPMEEADISEPIPVLSPVRAMPVPAPVQHSSPVRQSVLTAYKSESAKRVERLKLVLTKYINACVFCLYLDEITVEHATKDCPTHQSQVAALKMVNLRSNFRYPNYCACFDCGQPQGFCNRWTDDGRQASSCEYNGLVKGFLAIALVNQDLMLRVLNDMNGDGRVSQAEPKAQLKYFGDERKVLGMRSCRAFAVMVHLLERAGEDI